MKGKKKGRVLPVGSAAPPSNVLLVIWKRASRGVPLGAVLTPPPPSDAADAFLADADDAADDAEPSVGSDFCRFLAHGKIFVSSIRRKRIDR